MINFESVETELSFNRKKSDLTMKALYFERSMISRTAALIAAAIMLLFSSSADAAPATTPQIDREASEATFLTAYEHFVNNRFWSCLDSLDRALEQNVYFVDAYYMRSLAYRKLGLYPQAIEAMDYYMEVRHDDPRAGTIADTMREEWRAMRGCFADGLGGAPFSFTSHTLRSLFALPVSDPLSMRGLQGLGKISSFSDRLFVCDIYGDSLFVFSIGSTDAPRAIEIEHPAAYLPSSPNAGLVLCKSGDVLRVELLGTSADIALVGSIDANISDGAYIDSSLIAAADRTGQEVRIYTLPSLELSAEWRPTDADSLPKLFEPSAVASFGPFLAIADRANERVHIVDAYTLAQRTQFDVPQPRDLEWGSEGELYVISESGMLYSIDVFSSEASGLKKIADGLDDAWSIAMTQHGPLVGTVGGRIWWDSHVNPGYRDTIGSLSLYAPWLEDSLETETLFLRATVASFYQKFMDGIAPVTQAIWRNEQRPSGVMEIVSIGRSPVKSYIFANDGAHSAPRMTVAQNLTDVMDDIARSSRDGEELPRVILLDTRIVGSEDDVLLFAAFLMRQGIRLDLWSIARPPSIMMERISLTTIGSIYYDSMITSLPPNSSSEWIIALPMPPDTYTFGYPSDSTLSIYADVDVIRFADWMPIWPSLLKKR